MGMELVMIGVMPTQIELLAESPALLKDFIAVANHEAGQANFAAEIEALPPEARDALKTELREGKTEFAKSRHQRSAEIANVRQRLEMLGPIEQPLGLGKMWHVLHYALAGDSGMAGSYGDILLAGQEIGEERGYGPARLIDPAETAYFSRYIETLDSVELQDGLNVQEMRQAGVYPRYAGAEDPQAVERWRRNVGRLFLRLQHYLSRMADKGNGLLMWGC